VRDNTRRLCVGAVSVNRTLGRIRAAALKLEHAPDFVRYDLLERFGKLV
jgi:hypothetical protein